MKLAYFILFGLSGLAGLIYEHVWSQYLKLFLGHDAYAQMLVIIIFMGGMAIGAWLTSKVSDKIPHLFKAYAICELIIGLFGFSFHQIFSFATNISYQTIIPQLQLPMAVNLAKWSIAAIIIIPQSILLGATFPLFTGGMLRMQRGGSGSAIASLYFVNSLGGAIGILISGFVLVQLVGLPGASLTAGIINIVIGGIVWYLAKTCHNQPVQTPKAQSIHNNLVTTMLACSSLTGLASFLYEIGWIRMLSLVLGSSSHAFELMISAFIFGLAFGGLAIKNRLDKLTSPITTLAIIQIAMGILALSTIVLYNQLFIAMRYSLTALATTNEGYSFFNVISHFLALILMLPTTFCAGMTLPLITNILISNNCGERSIGRVYAVNTIGAIIGTWAALNFIMPTMGLKLVIGIGAILDLSIGIFLLWFIYRSFKTQILACMTTFSIIITSGILAVYKFDPVKMASGVFRYKNIATNKEMLFHKDGKTATIALYKNLHPTDDHYSVTLATNGKPDASISYSDTPSSDEHTQILLAALPWAIYPQASNAAVIGLGSGMTTNFLLHSPKLNKVDTIEIEPAVVEAAKLFGKPVANVFSDLRSEIHTTDAKVFFATQKQQYDLIISEPSDTWVSGIASLFTKEFYANIKNYLTPNGLLVQWMHGYEINLVLLASIINSLDSQFSNYDLYFLNDRNIAIIASNNSTIPLPTNIPFKYTDSKEQLAKIDINNEQDLLFRRFASGKLLSPLFKLWSNNYNSDYFPIVDLNAVKSRFRQDNIYALYNLQTASIPILGRLSPEHHINSEALTDNNLFPPIKHAKIAHAIEQYIATGKKSILLDFSITQALSALTTDDLLCNGQKATWLKLLANTLDSTMPYLSAVELQSLWQRLSPKRCLHKLDNNEQQQIAIYNAFIKQDFAKLASISAAALPNIDHKSLQYLNTTTLNMFANLKLQQPKEALDALQEMQQHHKLSIFHMPINVQLLYALALQNHS